MTKKHKPKINRSGGEHFCPLCGRTMTKVKKTTRFPRSHWADKLFVVECVNCDIKKVEEEFNNDE